MNNPFKNMIRFFKKRIIPNSVLSYRSIDSVPYKMDILGSGMFICPVELDFKIIEIVHTHPDLKVHIRVIQRTYINIPELNYKTLKEEVLVERAIATIDDCITAKDLFGKLKISDP